MYRGRSVCVVVPARDEEQHIGDVIRRCPPLVDYIVVVDDCSTDRTVSTVRAQADPRVILVQHSVNQGVGGALVSGYHRALDLHAGLCVVMAGDGQMDPYYLPDLLDPICSEEADFAKGNRFCRWSSIRRMPIFRALGTLCLTWMTRAATGYWHLADAQNGYVAIAREALAQIDLDNLARGYAVENTMLMEMSRIRARVRDVPIPARYGTEVSGMRIWRDGLSIALVVVRGCFVRVSNSFRPVP